MTSVATRLDDIRSRIARAAEASLRPPSDVRLVAVSKKQPSQQIRDAYAAGQRLFGENYAQELAAKAAELSAPGMPDLEWHMIGHLQSNKARLVAPIATMVEAVDSSELATELGRRAASAGRTIEVLIEVNVSGEAAKSGCTPADLERVADSVRACPALVLKGLMTMPPYTADAAEATRWFVALRELRDARGGARDLPELSMGMSHDFEQAIAAGATIVRIGTAIFGPRAR